MVDSGITPVLQVFTAVIQGWVDMIMPYMIAAVVITWTACIILAIVKYRKKHKK